MIELCAFSDEAASSIEGQIEALKRNGINYAEIRGIDGKNIKDITLEQAAGYAKQLQGSGIKVWAIGSPLGKEEITVDFNQYKETVKHICRLANIFNAKNIRIFSFFNAYGQESAVFDYLNQMTEIADSYNVSLCHENEKDIFGDTVERVLRLKDNVKGLKFIFDPANYIQCGEDVSAALKALYGMTEYFHIKDIIASTSELVPAGLGDGGIDKIIGMIQGSKVLTLEPHLAVFDGYSQIDRESMKNKYHFKDNAHAFDAAVNALKGLLKEAGYREQNGGYIKNAGRS